MSAITETILKRMQEVMRLSSKPKTEAYDTTAEVVRVENGVAWVHIPGGVEETPVRLTIAAKKGDNVQVRVSGGRAYLAGNGTAPPTDDTIANIANENAVLAGTAAAEAMDAADRAESDAQRAHEAADSAQVSANNAQVSANNANEYASRALSGLSTVQSVVETLNWITEHGTMTLTTDTSLDPTHVYFVVDANGDYVVGNTHYSVVSDPSADDLGSYYVLSIDESLQNYVGTHLAVTSEGLWLLPEANGNKVLIATGAGSTYTTAGTYVIDSNGYVLAVFSSSQAQIGRGNAAHATIGTNSFAIQTPYDLDILNIYGTQVNNERGVLLSNNSDQSQSSISIPNEVKIITGSQLVAYAGKLSDSSYTASATFTYGTSGSQTSNGYTFAYNGAKTVTISKASSVGKALIEYRAAELANCKYVMGTLASSPASSGNNILAFGANNIIQGNNAVVLGADSKAIGNYAVALGWQSYATNESAVAMSGGSASGFKSFAGCDSQATNRYSFAFGNGVKSNGESQTAIGKYNVSDTSSLFIIGNGTGSSARKNAFKVDSDGTTTMSGTAWFKTLVDNNIKPGVVSLLTDTTMVAELGSNSTSFFVTAQWGASGYSQRQMAFPASDVRLKKNIEPCEVESALDVLNQIQMHSFDWLYKVEEHQKIGFIADELEKIDPHLTMGGGYTKDGTMNIKSVNTFYMIGYMVKAIQELSEKVTELENEVRRLKHGEPANS